MGEQMDRLKALIDSLPDDGACVVMLTNDFARYLRKGIVERRGVAFERKCRVVGIHRLSSVAKLTGECRRVVIDPKALEHMNPAVERAAACVNSTLLSPNP